MQQNDFIIEIVKEIKGDILDKLNILENKIQSLEERIILLEENKSKMGGKKEDNEIQLNKEDLSSLPLSIQQESPEQKEYPGQQIEKTEDLQIQDVVPKQFSDNTQIEKEKLGGFIDW